MRSTIKIGLQLSPSTIHLHHEKTKKVYNNGDILLNGLRTALQDSALQVINEKGCSGGVTHWGQVSLQPNCGRGMATFYRCTPQVTMTIQDCKIKEKQTILIQGKKFSGGDHYVLDKALDKALQSKHLSTITQNALSEYFPILELQ